MSAFVRPRQRLTAETIFRRPSRDGTPSSSAALDTKSMEVENTAPP
jgi:hypothetical protein